MDSEYSVIVWTYKSVVDEVGVEAAQNWARFSLRNTVAGIGGRITGGIACEWSQDFAEMTNRYAIRVSAIVETAEGTGQPPAVTGR
jgi:hypothetical protein